MKIYDILETTKFHYGCGKEFIGKDDQSSVWTCRLEPRGKGHFMTSRSSHFTSCNKGGL